MHLIGAFIGAVLTGLMYWMLIGNGREVINAWLDARNEKDREARTTADSIRAREQEKRAPLRAITDPREAATAIMIAVAEARGTLTDEQRQEIKAQMRTVLGYDDALDQHIALAIHAARSAASPGTVIDESSGLLLDKLDTREKHELVAMVEAVAGLHGGATDAQETLVERLCRRLGIAPDQRKGG